MCSATVWTVGAKRPMTIFHQARLGFPEPYDTVRRVRLLQEAHACTGEKRLRRRWWRSLHELSVTPVIIEEGHPRLLSLLHLEYTYLLALAPAAMTKPASPSGSKAPAAAAANSSDRAALLITYVNIILYALCYQLQRPVEPFLVQALSEKAGNNVDSVNQTYGRLNSFFSTVQTIGSPLVGILLDRVGIRYASALVFLSSALSYGILASSTDLTLLFVSKIPTALQHAFLVAQATAVFRLPEPPRSFQSPTHGVC